MNRKHAQGLCINDDFCGFDSFWLRRLSNQQQMAVVFVLVIVSLIANAVADCSPSATTHNDDLYPIANQDYCRLYGNFGFGKTLDCSASPCNTSESFYTQWEVRSGQHWSWSADNNPGSQVNYTGSYRPHICVNENGSLILTSYDMSELLSWPVLIINMTCSKVIDNDNSSVPCSTHRFKFEVFRELYLSYNNYNIILIIIKL